MISDPKVTIVLPSYNPDEKLLDIVNGVIAYGFTDIIIVNDGSKPSCLKYFDEVKRHPQCTVLYHEVNRGKGAALKTAFSHYLSREIKTAGVVTIDGDNQHLPADILNCANTMVERKNKVIFGCRDFSLPGIPPRSVFGNKVTSFIFRTGCGIRLSDTQTGLRAIPARYLPSFIKIRGDRFEYETNMILEMKRLGIPYEEVKIETVYLDDNASSHFNPIIDSFKIYKTILAFMLSSILSFIIDLSTFNLFAYLLIPYMQEERIILSTILARIISSLFNFFSNNSIVFQSNDSKRKNFLKYYALCIPQMLISAGVVYSLSLLAGGSGHVLLTAIKIVIDSILFFISFKIQRDLIFKRKDDIV
ncbi:MAG: glycosyltransferase [Clostridiales bacterium]|nr:glycosyltransferase [Clostridiales bacterium]